MPDYPAIPDRYAEHPETQPPALLERELHAEIKLPVPPRDMINQQCDNRPSAHRTVPSGQPNSETSKKQQDGAKPQLPAPHGMESEDPSQGSDMKPARATEVPSRHILHRPGFNQPQPAEPRTSAAGQGGKPPCESPISPEGSREEGEGEEEGEAGTESKRASQGTDQNTQKVEGMNTLGTDPERLQPTSTRGKEAPTTTETTLIRTPEPVVRQAPTQPERVRPSESGAVPKTHLDPERRRGEQSAAREAYDNEVRKMKREQIVKAFHVGRYRQSDGTTMPAREADAELMQTSIQIIRNIDAISTGSERIHEYEKARNYVSPHTESDPIRLQEFAEQFVEQITHGVPKLDLSDMILAAGAISFVIAKTWEDNVRKPMSDSERQKITNNTSTLITACVQEVLRLVPMERLAGEDEVSLNPLGQRIFGVSIEDDAVFKRLKWAIMDRIKLGEFYIRGDFDTRSNRPAAEQTPYNRPLAAPERNRLNNVAADTIEELFALKAYGIVPFIVDGRDLGLPFDIVVTPPLSGNASYDFSSPGILADFHFTIPTKGHQEEGGELIRYVEDSEQNLVSIDVGRAPMIGHFRLYDDGQLTYGDLVEKAPCGMATEKYSAEFNCLDAFTRLRGLFIALVFDAVVPDDVVAQGRAPRSVAATLRPEEHPLDERVTDILLRRRESLQRAGGGRGQGAPRNWPLPRMDVGGYIKRLPENCRARPTAEQDARDYYASIRVAFEGLPEGYTFTGPYTRNKTSTRTVTHRAKFRPSSATRKLKDNL